MSSSEFVVFISGLAVSIAKDKDADEIAILSAFFTQLRGYFGYNFCC